MRRRTQALAAAVGVAALAAAAWCVAPSLVDDPLEELARHTPVRTWTDRRGRPVWYERTYDGEWRFPVKLAEIPDEVRAFTLNVEDSRFYRHGGVDYLAALRAFVQDFGASRVLSGASTVSMQVAGLAHPKRPGESFAARLWRKVRQAVAARKLERRHAKDEILEAYFNHLPYGGKIVGIRSAAAYYFGLEVRDLTVAEASLLVGIPQAPNRFRPDRHPEAARRRQRLVLDSQVRAGRLTPEEAGRIYASDHLRYRDFGVKTDWEERGSVRDWRFVLGTAGGTNGADACRLSVDRDLCADLRRTLARRIGGGVRDAAAVVLDVKTHTWRGYVGTLDFDAPKGGQVDAARAIRSAGSTLKPFIYLEALSGGVITPETRLMDAPVRYAGYAPGNYDGTYRGEVTATEALSRSLNTPVVRLLAALGESRVNAAFARYGLDGSVKTNGLALALGSAGYRLADVARAYGRLAEAAGPRAEWAPAVRLSEMLRTLPLPGAAELDVAWKTGTSNNLKDAWCFAYTPEWVVGVWYGNKDGKPCDRLVGVEIAAPAAGEIMSRLYEGRPAAIAWGRAAAGPQTTAGLLKARERVMLLSPAPQVYLLPPGAKTLTLDLRCSEPDVYWYWNGTGLGHVSEQAFPAGHHRVTAVPSDAARPVASVEFAVAE